jgi:hypothetical protein
MSTTTRAVSAVPRLSLPADWESLLASWPQAEAPAGVTGTIRRVRDDGLLAKFHATGDFVPALRATLSGAAHSVVVTYSDPRQVVKVVSLLGALLGEVTYAASPTLGGPASAVPTGGIDRYEQAWHTDSTPWTAPNRWSVLGLLREDLALRNAPTSILPWSALDAGLREDAEVWQALRGRRFYWRGQYPGLPQLSAPIDGDVPRWFRPALAPLIDDPARRVAVCHAVDETLRRVTSWYEAAVGPGRVLIFDNRAVLHRGPAVRQPSHRTLLRLKVDGTPE